MMGASAEPIPGDGTRDLGWGARGRGPSAISLASGCKRAGHVQAAGRQGENTQGTGLEKARCAGELRRSWWLAAAQLGGE